MNKASHWSWVLLLCCLLALSGCKALQRLRGEGFDDKDASWGAGMRPPGPPGQVFGFSERAREIERNVGVR